MRVIDAALTAALASGAGRPIITACLGATTGPASISATPTRYKLTGTSLEFEIPYTSNNAYPAIWLTRGVSIGGADYTLTSGRFRTMRLEYLPGRIAAFGELFPNEYYSAAGDDTYQNVITAFCTAYGKTAVFRDPAAAWLAYKFFPAGKSIILNNANNFLNLLRQKYLIFAADNGDEEVLFYSCAPALGDPDKTYSPSADFARIYSYRTARYFMWRDELGTVHTDGTATDPIHNLGYLESTAAAPARHSLTWASHLTTRPDFEIIDGDTFALSLNGSTLKNYALVTEEYTAPDKSHAHPRWFTTIDYNPIFANTEGGAVPSTIERVSNYTPLNTSLFDGILGPSHNNLQAAIDKLDDAAKITWTTVTTFANSWANQAGGTPAAYGIDGMGNVFLRGAIASGTMQRTAFTLPDGFRPAVQVVKTTNANSLFAMYVVQTTGEVQPWAGANSWFQLEASPFQKA